MIPESDTAAVRRAIRDYYKKMECSDAKKIGEISAQYEAARKMYLSCKPEVISLKGR